MIASILQLAARILGYGSYRNLPDALYDRPDRTEELPDPTAERPGGCQRRVPAGLRETALTA